MRTEIERRPLLLLCLALIVGISASEVPINALFLIPLLLVGQVSSRVTTAFGFFFGVVIAPGSVQAKILESQFYIGEAVVVSVPEHVPGGMRAVVEMESRRVHLYYPAPSIALGDTLRLAGVLQPVSKRSPVSAQMRLEAGPEIVSYGNSVARLGTEWRDAFLAWTGKVLPAPAATVVAALCFNVDDLLDDGLEENLRRTGTTHIISTSGLHVVIFALGLQGLLSLLPVPRWANLVLLTLVLTVYATATGLHPPVVRAVIMAAVYFSAFLFRREPDLLSALAFAALAWLVFDPAAAFQIGFQLSFVAVASMGLLLQAHDAPPHEPVRRVGRQAKDLVVVGLAASIGTMPLIAYTFGTISIVSPVANLLVAVVLAPVILIALLAFGVSFVSPAVGVGLMVGIVAPLAGWVRFVADTLGSLPFASVQVPPFNAYWLVLVYGLMLVVWRKKARPASSD